MRLLITGTSKGIGRTIALYFLDKGYEVVGLDILKSSISNKLYTHYIADVSKKEELPNISNIDIIVNNAGKQTNTEEDIEVNLKGTINVCEKYLESPNLKSILNMASASSITGSEFSYYAASKGGVVSYTKNLALKLASRKILCNALSCGGVITESNKHILESNDLYQKVLNETLLNKWMTEEEVSEYVYFMTVINKSMTGENILVDNGEALKSNFIW